MAKKSEMKTVADGKDVTEWLAAIEDDTRRNDCETLIDIMRRATGYEPETWGSIIGFDRYRYSRADKSEHQFPIIGLANRKQSLTVYIMPGFETYADQLERLGKHKHSKSCLYIKRLSDVDLQPLEEMVIDSVRIMRERYPTGNDA